MKREILFRGKRTDNGEWVCGYFVKYRPYASEDEFMCGIVPTHASDLYLIEVDPETVEQYSGLKDTGLHGGDGRGNKIFEGDILFSINAEERHYGIVKFGKHTNSHGNSDVGFYVQWPSTMYRTDIGFWASNNCCWIVGNIYDNPELLEVKHDDD